ncbi:hypothetical protein [Spirosoma spitsbergense]|uniref:hypothetical protein n=1 Tax=Spirosoma spitsbergense TaxID=431554 RepID=UPI00036C21B6|nr:hypothetical protein [Spirosoma spitsbergense]
MSTTTIQEHYDALKHKDLDSWLAMHGQLAIKYHMKSDCLTYFKRSILEKESKQGESVDISVLPYWIVKQFVDFFGFTWENISTNTIPLLSETNEPVTA